MPKPIEQLNDQLNQLAILKPEDLEYLTDDYIPRFANGGSSAYDLQYFLEAEDCFNSTEGADIFNEIIAEIKKRGLTVQIIANRLELSEPKEIASTENTTKFDIPEVLQIIKRLREQQLMDARGWENALNIVHHMQEVENSQPRCDEVNRFANRLKEIFEKSNPGDIIYISICSSGVAEQQLPLEVTSSQNRLSIPNLGDGKHLYSLCIDPNYSKSARQETSFHDANGNGHDYFLEYNFQNRVNGTNVTLDYFATCAALTTPEYYKPGFIKIEDELYRISSIKNLQVIVGTFIGRHHLHEFFKRLLSQSSAKVDSQFIYIDDVTENHFIKSYTTYRRLSDQDELQVTRQLRPDDLKTSLMDILSDASNEVTQRSKVKPRI